MGAQKTIPDKSNFLEKFAAIESYLQENALSGNESKAEVKKNVESSNSFENGNSHNEIEQTVIPQKIISEITSAQLKCTNCGANRNPQHAFCFSCGQKYEPISTASADEPEPQVNSLQETVLKCAECGTIYEKDDVFCMNCGNKL